MSLAAVIAFVLYTVIYQFVRHEVEAASRTDYHDKHCHLDDEKADEVEKRHHYYCHTLLSVKNYVNQLKDENKAIKAAYDVGSSCFELEGGALCNGAPQHAD